MEALRKRTGSSPAGRRLLQLLQLQHATHRTELAEAVLAVLTEGGALREPRRAPSPSCKTPYSAVDDAQLEIKARTQPAEDPPQHLRELTWRLRSLSFRHCTASSHGEAAFAAIAEAMHRGNHPMQGTEANATTDWESGLRAGASSTLGFSRRSW